MIRNVNTQSNSFLAYMNNNVVIGSGAYGPTLVTGSSWGLRSLGDFNRDSHPDYALFNSSSGQTAILYLSGPTLIGGAYGPRHSHWLGACGDSAILTGMATRTTCYTTLAARQTAIWYLNNNTYVSGALRSDSPRWLEPSRGSRF